MAEVAIWVDSVSQQQIHNPKQNTMNSKRHSNSAFRAFLWLLIAPISILFFLNPARAEEAAVSPSPPAKVTGAESSPAVSPAPSATPTPLPKVATVKGLIKLHDTLEVDCDGLK